MSPPPPPPSLQFACATADTKSKKSKQRSSHPTNPYADRGREKFSALLAQVEEQRQNIMAKVGKDDVSLIRFVCTKDDRLKPVVVFSNNGNSIHGSSDRSFKGKDKTLEQKATETAAGENGLKPRPVGLSNGNRTSSSGSSSSGSGSDGSFKGNGSTLEEKMKTVVVDDDEQVGGGDKREALRSETKTKKHEADQKGIMLFGVEDRRLLVKKLKAEVAKIQLQPYHCYLAALLIIVSVSLASVGNRWSHMYILHQLARLGPQPSLLTTPPVKPRLAMI